MDRVSGLRCLAEFSLQPSPLIHLRGYPREILGQWVAPCVCWLDWPAVRPLAGGPSRVSRARQAAGLVGSVICLTSRWQRPVDMLGVIVRTPPECHGRGEWLCVAHSGDHISVWDLVASLGVRVAWPSGGLRTRRCRRQRARFRRGPRIPCRGSCSYQVGCLGRPECGTCLLPPRLVIVPTASSVHDIVVCADVSCPLDARVC